MIHCNAPHDSTPDILCALESGHGGDVHVCPSPGNATAIVWPVETWPRWRSVKDEPPPKEEPTARLSPERRAELRALAEQATPGPWSADESLDGPGSCAVYLGDPEGGPMAELSDRPFCRPAPDGQHESDAAYIAALDPGTVLALLAEVADLRVDLEQVHAKFVEMSDREVAANAQRRETDGPYKSMWEAERLLREHFEAEVAEMRATVAAQARGLEAVATLMADSRGVAGLHRNGDEAPWDELRTGGRFEEWLVEFDIALASQSGKEGGSR